MTCLVWMFVAASAGGTIGVLVMALLAAGAQADDRRR